MPVTSYAQFHVNESARAAREAHARQMKGELELYVWYKPMRIEAHPDKPGDEWTLAWPERLPTSLTADQMVQYFAARTGRLPYLKRRRAGSRGRSAPSAGEQRP